MALETIKRRAELALHRAIESGDVRETSRLLGDGVGPNCIGESSRNFKYAFTALCAAIDGIRRADRRVKIHATLREAIPTVSLVEADYAANRANCIEIMKLLLASGADPNRSTFSRTPLSLAAFTGDAEIVRLLLDAGASPKGDALSPFSKLPRPKRGLAFYGNALHEAAEKGFAEVVRLLCTRGADLSARNHEGKTALQIARTRGHTDIVHILEQCEKSNVKQIYEPKP